MRDLISIARLMKQQLGRALIKETQIKMEMAEIRNKERKCRETREIEKIEERLHGKDGVKEDAHTHTEVVRLNEGELAERVETRCGQRDSLLRERRETLCSPEADLDQVGSVVPSEVEEKSAANGCTRSFGGYGGPGSSCGDANPRCDCPQHECPGVCGYECGSGVCGVDVRVHERGKMRAATHA